MLLLDVPREFRAYAFTMCDYCAVEGYLCMKVRLGIGHSLMERRNTQSSVMPHFYFIFNPDNLIFLFFPTRGQQPSRCSLIEASWAYHLLGAMEMIKFGEVQCPFIPPGSK